MDVVRCFVPSRVTVATRWAGPVRSVCRVVALVELVVRSLCVSSGCALWPFWASKRRIEFVPRQAMIAGRRRELLQFTVGCAARDSNPEPAD
jgi:hypothetical protein